MPLHVAPCYCKLHWPLFHHQPDETVDINNLVLDVFLSLISSGIAAAPLVSVLRFRWYLMKRSPSTGNFTLHFHLIFTSLDECYPASLASSFANMLPITLRSTWMTSWTEGRDENATELASCGLCGVQAICFFAGKWERELAHLDWTNMTRWA